MGVVTVYFDKINNNRQDADSLDKSDPCVMFRLEQDTFFSDGGINSKRREMSTPQFCRYGETFEFPKVATIQNLVLHVRVLDDNCGRDNILGFCPINLEKLKEGGKMEIEKALQQRKPGGWLSKKAKIYLKVSYTSE
jgi:hypothetical protein